MARILTAEQLHKELVSSGIFNAKGSITMQLNNVNVLIKSKDTVGNMLQSWLAEWMKVNNIYFKEKNTQEFPDFFLSNDDLTNILEVKSYIAHNQPGFDVANFDSYCNSLRSHPERLDAKYLIFGYELDEGSLSIHDLFLKNIWEITGPSSKYPITSQWKNKQLYNIRPIGFNKKHTCFKSRADFIVSLYRMNLFRNKMYDAEIWLNDVIKQYKNVCNFDLLPEVNKLLNR
jgi:hypothetical protein